MPKSVLIMKSNFQFFILILLVLLIIYAIKSFKNRIKFASAVTLFLILIYLSGSYITFVMYKSKVYKNFYLFTLKKYKNIKEEDAYGIKEPYDNKLNPNGYKDYVFVRQYRIGENKHFYFFYIPGTITEFRAY